MLSWRLAGYTFSYRIGGDENKGSIGDKIIATFGDKDIDELGVKWLEFELRNPG